MNGRAFLRRLVRTDMVAAAKVYRTAFDARLPWLVGIHTPEEDAGYWATHLFEICEIWGVERSGVLLGVIAFCEGWVEQLYVLPDGQGQGLGSQLLAQAMSSHSKLQLWTFQCNHPARRFYEARGFVAIEKTDGRDNEEQEPDILYRWQDKR